MSITFRIGAQPLEIVRNDGLLRILTGGPGLRGLPGPGGAGTIEIGTVTTLDPGDSATVENSGSPTAAVLNFALPKGDKGDKGDQGDQGNPGLGAGGYGLPLGGSVGQALVKTGAGDGASGWAARREVLIANRTYYVRIDGSDANNGLSNSAGGAFLTPQKAWNVVAALDLSIYSVTIQIGDGTYTSGINMNAAPVGGTSITILGNPATPANCYMNLTGNFIAVNSPVAATMTVNGFKVKPAGSGYSGILMNAPAIITTLNIEAAGGSTGGFAGFYHVNVQGAKIYVNPTGQSITGNLAAYIVAISGVIQFFGGATIPLTGTPAFSWAFAIATRVGIILAGGTLSFSGAATGRRYSIAENSVCETSGGGANYFPGDIAGTAQQGGQYL